MRKLLTFLIALGAIVFAVGSPTSAQIIGGGVWAAPRASYQGPADITFNGSSANVKEFWSCDRAVNNAHASPSTSLCDAVQGASGASPGTLVCTLRATTTGLWDNSAYCPGGLTPVAACAAITGGCNVSNAYGQIGVVGSATQATVASQPALVFATIGGVTTPVMTCSAATCVLIAGSSFTLAQPFVMATVYIRNPTSTASGQIVGGGTSITSLISSDLTVANRFACDATGGGQAVVATDVIWHGGIALFNTTTTSVLSVDGSNTGSSNCGTGGFSSEGIRLFRGAGGANQMDGSIAEAMIVGSTASTTDFNNLFANMNGTNGYNGGL